MEDLSRFLYNFGLEHWKIFSNLEQCSIITPQNSLCKSLQDNKCKTIKSGFKITAAQTPDKITGQTFVFPDMLRSRPIKTKINNTHTRNMK
jgi:hypothetical protein